MRAHGYWGALAALLVVVGTALALGPLGAGSAASRPHPGDLDPSFGTGGTVAESLFVGQPYVQAIAVQPDRKIVALVTDPHRRVRHQPHVPLQQLVRYLPDGSPDPSFGKDGHVDTSLWMGIRALALQPDGKIVVAGCFTTVPPRNVIFVVARFNVDGSFDTGFGNNGRRQTRIRQSERSKPWYGCATAVALARGGRILVGGSARYEGHMEYDYGSNFDLVRYRPNGSLDPTFGDRGIVQTGMGNSILAGIAVRPDGMIAASGTDLGNNRMADRALVLVVYKPDGSGAVAGPTIWEFVGGPPALQDGKILVAGTYVGTDSLGSTYAAVARFTWAGRLDTTFGEDGFASATLGGTEHSGAGASTIVTQPNGKIVIAGNGGDGRSPDSGYIGRLLPDGRLDRSFGKAGVVSLGKQQVVDALALQPDRKLLVGGGRLDAWTLSRLFLGDEDCIVPALRGRTVPEATARLKNASCRRGHIVKRFSRSVHRGLVVSTRPRMGTRLPGGAKVGLVVSRGRPAHRSH